MAKAEKPKQDSARGRSKAANRAGTRTAANKVRAAETRMNRLARAADRRMSSDYTIPMDAVIPATQLPKKQQAAMGSVYDVHGDVIMVPDPRRGTRKSMALEILHSRTAQAARIAIKREARRRLSTSPAKAQHESRQRGLKQWQPGTAHFKACAPRRMRAHEG